MAIPLAVTGARRMAGTIRPVPSSIRRVRSAARAMTAHGLDRMSGLSETQAKSKPMFSAWVRKPTSSILVHVIPNLMMSPDATLGERAPSCRPTRATANARLASWHQPGQDWRVDNLETELTRIAQREPIVQAWVARHSDADLVEAHRALRSDKTGSGGDGFGRLGPLAGWSFGVKDVIDTADLPTERGSPIYAGRQTANDAACVALVRQAGAVVTGKTATTEFAIVKPAATTNPHDPERTPGGSSSGSAAAVADCMVRAAFGTQTVGSVLRPASFCGVVGFKPSHQLIPLTGVASLSPSFDTVGWFTRSVDDCGAVLRALTVGARGGVEEVTTGPAARSESRVPGGLRIGRYRSHQWEKAQPELEAVLDGAAERLAEHGVQVIDFEPLEHLDGFFEAADTVFQYEISRVFSWERQHHFDKISPLFQRLLERAEQVSPAAHVRAQRELATARRAHSDFLHANALDAMLTPTAPGEAPPLKTTGDSVFNRTWTSLGVPAINLPAATGPSGLPIGLTLAGSMWGDPELLAIAAAVETIVAADSGVAR